MRGLDAAVPSSSELSNSPPFLAAAGREGALGLFGGCELCLAKGADFFSSSELPKRLALVFLGGPGGREGLLGATAFAEDLGGGRSSSLSSSSKIPFFFACCGAGAVGNAGFDMRLGGGN